MKKIQIEEEDLFYLIWWARRYCDGRMTGVPHDFNRIYKKIRTVDPDFIRVKDKMDKTLYSKGKFWPYAQDGMFDETSGIFDAR